MIKTQGVSVQEANGIRISPFSDKVEVLAGMNILILAVNPGNFGLSAAKSDTLRLTFNAAAGETYLVTARRGYGRLCAYPLKPTSGKPDFDRPAGCVLRQDGVESTSTVNGAARD